MQVSASQLENHLKRGLQSLYTVYGEELLLVQEAGDSIRAMARAQGFSERCSFTVAGARFDWGEVLAAAGSMSLFADRQLLELSIPSGKPGVEGSAMLQRLADSAAGNDSTLCLITLDRKSVV